MSRKSCIIIPSILSNSAPDIAELESDSNRLSEIYALSLTSRGRHIPSRTWQQKLKRDDWMQHLSGRTCSTSRMENFEDWWISRLRESRASHIATQDYAREGATSDSSLTTGLPESSKCVRAASSSKTSKDCSPVRCQMELFASGGRWRDWNAWATGLRAAYSARRNAARLILGSVFSFWPTPTTAEAGKISNRRNYGQIGLSNHPAIRGKEMARVKSLKNRNGQPGQNTSNMNGSLEESAKLNPAWVESLLGLPLGWTDCASSETESSPQPPLSHSEL